MTSSNFACQAIEEQVFVVQASSGRTLAAALRALRAVGSRPRSASSS